MKLLHQQLERNGIGTVKLIPEDSNDMWTIYNLVNIDDTIQSSTLRKVQKDTLSSSNELSSSSSSTHTQKLRIVLTITVETIDFDIDTCTLRLKGKNIAENEYVKLGQYHTLELDINRTVTLTKPYWDSIHIDILAHACDMMNKAELCAVLMQADGICNICVVMPNITVVKQKIELNIPRKRAGTTHTNTALHKFYNIIIDAMKRHIDLDVIKVIVIGSPGFIKDEFYSYMMSESIKSDDKLIQSNKHKFILCHSSSGYKHSIDELLSNPTVLSRIENTRAYDEIRTLDEFYTILNDEPDKAYYGYIHVHYADTQNAVQKLLLSDELLRSNSIDIRRQYVELVDSVKSSGGDVIIFSAQHTAGEQLTQLSGVAAILRFPLAESDIMEIEQKHQQNMSVENNNNTFTST